MRIGTPGDAEPQPDEKSYHGTIFSGHPRFKEAEKLEKGCYFIINATCMCREHIMYIILLL